MKVWDAIRARVEGFWCQVRGHDVKWWTHRDLPVCPGDIVCYTCHVVHWCRAHDPWMPELEEE